MTPVLVLTTVGASFDPRSLANELVEKRLAACVNIVPQLHSVYRWQGKIENDSEQLLLIKTIDSRVDELQKTLFSMHPYEVPEFIVLRLDDLRGPYRHWLLDAVLEQSEERESLP